MSCFLSYSLTGITGDCSNLNEGSFGITIDGSAPDYTINWISPITDVIPLGAGVTAYTETNLSAGTYTFIITDSCLDPGNTTVGPISIYISSGVCTSITSVNNTVCSLDNGSLTATTEYDYGSNQFYLYHNTLGYITSATTTNTITPAGAVFPNLSAGTYYVVVTDGGGCSGTTTSVIVKDSPQLDYGVYIVNDAGCNVNSGKLFVTGLTGTPPYTYLWSNGETTDSITGLTAGSYDITVSDNSGCVVNKTEIVLKVPTVGQAGVLVASPACFGNNGTVTVLLSGGTAPYYFSGSNGTVTVTFDNFYEFSNLPAGVLSYFVQDSGLCSFTSNVSVLSQQSFNLVSVNTTNSKCNDTSGTITPLVSSGTPPYIFKLTSSNGYTNSITTTLTSFDFTGLASGTYTLSIKDGSNCEYTDTYVIENEVLFSFEANTVDTSCGLSNGEIQVVVDGGTGPFLYEINGISEILNSRTKTFLNFDNGSYTLSVTDTSVPCKQSTTVLVGDSFGVDYVVNSQNPTGSNNGQIQLFITSGQPPFTYDWSSNVGSQTGQLITNLSAGTYTIKITDDNGCVKESTITLQGVNCSVSYEIYNFTQDTFKNTGDLITKGPIQMLNEGFNDLTLGDDNCILNQAIFEAYVSVSGVSATTVFYTGNTLFDVPSNTLWATTVRNLLLSFDGIGNVVINTTTNKITITTDCASEVSLLDSDILVNMIIHYDVSCVSCSLYCSYDQTGVCDGYKLTQTQNVGLMLNPTTVQLELYDGDNGEVLFKSVPKIVNVTSGCLNSYYYNQDPPVTDPEDIAHSNRELRNACLKAINELSLGTYPFTWANNFLPSFQINKFF